MMIYMLKGGFYEQNIRRRETERERAQETIENVKENKVSCTNLPRGPREESKCSRAPRRVPNEKIIFNTPPRAAGDLPSPPRPAGLYYCGKIAWPSFPAQNSTSQL